jgi:hypothetical protein
VAARKIPPKKGLKSGNAVNIFLAEAALPARPNWFARQFCPHWSV